VDSRPLGRTGIAVSEFIFGAGAIGGIGSSPTTRAHGLSPGEGLARLDEARDLGITVIDTADAYGGGESERTVGRWLAERQVTGTLVATKVGNAIRPDGSVGVDLSPAHIARQLTQSIDRLGRVDLYLSHAPDPGTPVEQTAAAFTQARADGKIRAYGVCNVSAAQLEEVLAAADRAGLDRPGWVQNQLSLLARDDERDLLPLLAGEELGYTPFSPLAGGVLSGRYLDGRAPAPGSRIEVAGDRCYPGMYTEASSRRCARRWPWISPRTTGPRSGRSSARGIPLTEATDLTGGTSCCHCSHWSGVTSRSVTCPRRLIPPGRRPRSPRRGPCRPGRGGSRSPVPPATANR
jgi:aryl-alcohol dehydrogenase-like predicted oxidoreductase